MTRPVPQMALALAVLATAAGCIETEQTYSINPDGAGKVDYSVVVTPALVGVRPRPMDPELTARLVARKLMSASTGVAVWRDVRVEPRPNGRVRFEGTAYFADVAATKLPLMKKSSVGWRRSADGNVALTVHQPSTERQPLVRSLTAEQVEKTVEKHRKTWRKEKRVNGPFLRALEIKMTFHLPGRATRVSSFEKKGSRTLALAFDGEKIYERIDAFAADDRLMEKAVRQGVNLRQLSPGASPLVDEHILDIEGPIRATVREPLELVFDYEEELAAARRERPAMLDRLGFDKLPEEPGGG